MALVNKQTNWVLVVEDEVGIRELMSETLSRIGYRVLECGNVNEALKLCTNQRFGCIILDYQLDDGGNGGQVAASIRDNKGGMNYTTPLLMISAHPTYEVLNQVGNQINSALVKPFKFDIFEAKVKELCPLLVS